MKTSTLIGLNAISLCLATFVAIENYRVVPSFQSLVAPLDRPAHIPSYTEQLRGNNNFQLAYEKHHKLSEQQMLRLHEKVLYFEKQLADFNARESKFYDVERAK